jgi:adenine-specific DNA methylase
VVEVNFTWYEEHSTMKRATTGRRKRTNSTSSSGLENRFDAAFASRLALREKQIQQNYRPIIGIHKWFARRPGTLFRSLLLAEFGDAPSLEQDYWKGQRRRGTIADPFMGGGTTLYEASRIGFDVLGCDVNPMSHWLVSRAFATLDPSLFAAEAVRVVASVKLRVGSFYKTMCVSCGDRVDVKYFLWVKNEDCPHCGVANDLFPGHLLAEAERHPRNVLVCLRCGCLNEYDEVPTTSKPASCIRCRGTVVLEGRTRRGKTRCQTCELQFQAPPSIPSGPPRHRMWAIEYQCPRCYPAHAGRQFKTPDSDDYTAWGRASAEFLRVEAQLNIPNDHIPPGDETTRLHRWGYKRYREMFDDRQLLTLGLLRQEILTVDDAETRNALLTVFSDILRYNNMLCRYDTYALKCQDIFSVHGFPVGLVQCENNVLGIDGVGSGGFVHFVEKYKRAKDYCARPFEVAAAKGGKALNIEGETIGSTIPAQNGMQAWPKSAVLLCQPSHLATVPSRSLDGVFTDPPYFANVQYAELMDFCFVWLRDVLGSSMASFAATTTRSKHEVTGNQSLRRGIDEFADGLSKVFCRFATGLKAGAPFVFTYHHNDPLAYAPLVMAILDAGLICTAVLPAAAEMTASLHIHGTDSSILDSVFVCRARSPRARRLKNGVGVHPSLFASKEFADSLLRDVSAMSLAGVRIGVGDVRCLASGLLALRASRALETSWKVETVQKRLSRVRTAIEQAWAAVAYELAVDSVYVDVATSKRRVGVKEAAGSVHAAAL